VLAGVKMNPKGILMTLPANRKELPAEPVVTKGNAGCELPRLRSGFRRVARTPRKRLNFDLRRVIRFVNDSAALRMTDCLLVENDSSRRLKFVKSYQG
jgi:hypothetical protein